MLITITGVAGAGKTRKSFEHAFNIAKSEDIRAICLTNKGKYMMKERYGERLNVSTVHSFAFKEIVKKIGGEDGIEVFDEGSKEIHFRTVYNLKYYENVKGFEVQNLPEGNKVDRIKRAIINRTLNYICESKTNTVMEIISKEKENSGLNIGENKIYDILHDFENYMITNKKFDFDYIILEALKKINYVDFDYEVLVWDEANDTMPLIVELIKKIYLMKKFKYVILNGDPAQTIYDHIIFSSPEHFKELFDISNEKILLNESKRLPKNIVSFVNNIYKKIPKYERIVDYIVTNKDGGKVINIDFNKIVPLSSLFCSNGEKSAIVCLSNNMCKKVANMLDRYGIPYSTFYEGGYYGWDYNEFAIRNFLYFCKNKIFDDEEFRLYYNTVKQYLPAKYWLNDFEIVNIEKVSSLFSNYVDVLKDLKCSEDWKKVFLQSLKFNKKFERSIEILTVHSAKGLEYDNTIVVLEPTKHLKKNFFDDKITTYYRRIIYTAITRSANKLFLVYEGISPNYI